MEDVVECFKESKAKPTKTTNSQDLRKLLKECYKRKTPTDLLKKKGGSSDQTTEDEEEESEIERDTDSENESTHSTLLPGKRKLEGDHGVTNPRKKLK